MKALILVDLQNDFLPGGALAVPSGNEVIPVAQFLMREFGLVVATQDWHPADHGSFAANHPDHSEYEVVDLNGLEQVLWPVHCVQGSPGAEFAEEIAPAKINRVFPKGTESGIDSYSGFFDNGRRKATGLGDYLEEQGIRQVFVLGLATDYCVKFTALDAASLGFETFVVTDGCRAVNVKPGDGEAAFREMEAAGCTLLKSREIFDKQLIASE